MTPTEQDKELREEWSPELFNFLYDASQAHGDTRKDEAAWLDKVTLLITADRKRVALEARIEELETLARSFANEPFDAPATIHAQKRLAELKQQQYEPSDYQKGAAKFNSDVQQQQSELTQKEE